MASRNMLDPKPAGRALLLVAAVALTAALELSQVAPAAAASWIEKNFYLLGPRYDAVVPPCDGLPPLPEAFPPRFDAPGELEILAARCLDIPSSLSASYCFGFFTLADFDGMVAPLP